MLTQLLFALLILFLPSNLAFHFASDTAIVGGTLVDYLIPKVYLTDLFVVAILLLARGRLAKLNWPFITFFLLTLITSFFTPKPIAAIWYWAKLIEMSLFVVWLRSALKLYAIRHWLFAGLTASVLWQSLLALAQWLKQGSIAGYWFFGEPVFNLATPGIARASFFGNLRVLPYGTTPHPNVLAGFIALSLVMSPSIAALPGTIVLFLTQSLSAITALTIPILRRSKILAIILLLLFAISYRPEAESFSRRLDLTRAAINMWRDHSLFGVGLNQFTVYLPAYAEISASTRFLQPVHNIYLLLLAETGLVGLALLALVLWPIIRRPSIPLLMILVIGLADHYPLTLQTGQLLLAIAIALAAPKSPNSDTPRVLSGQSPPPG